MPTVFREGPYRFFFYSGDQDEPVHIHVEREDKTAKVWLEPVRLHKSKGFDRLEISKILKIIDKHRELILEVWNEFFGN